MDSNRGRPRPAGREAPGRGHTRRAPVTAARNTSHDLIAGYAGTLAMAVVLGTVEQPMAITLVSLRVASALASEHSAGGALVRRLEDALLRLLSPLRG